jgi:hypothetical protein
MTVSTETTFSPEFIYETQDLIVSAISQDFNNIDISIAGHQSFVFEKEDPLGMAFYIFAISETGYASQEFTYKPEHWKYWVESRLDNDIPTPYLDTEVAALGLIIYSLCRQEIIPQNSSNFIRLVDEHFSASNGIYKNYIASVLAGLGISRLDANEPLLTKITDYIKKQIAERKKNIFNDSKNLVVTYLWSKEVGDDQIRNSVRQEVFTRFKGGNYLNRDIVYLAYVLIEEIKEFSRDERREIKKLVNESLKFIRNYTLENQSLSCPAEKDYHGANIALQTRELQDLYGYPNKPILSRILVSIGLLIEQKYISSPNLFDGSEQLLRKYSAAVGYFLPIICVSLLAFWGWQSFDSINNFKTDFVTKEFLKVAIGFLKAILSTLLLLSGLFTAALAVLIPYYLINDTEVKHMMAIKKSLSFSRKAVGTEAGLAIIINILTSLR